MELSNIFHKYK